MSNDANCIASFGAGGRDAVASAVLSQTRLKSSALAFMIFTTCIFQTLFFTRKQSLVSKYAYSALAFAYAVTLVVVYGIIPGRDWATFDKCHVHKNYFFIELIEQVSALSFTVFVIPVVIVRHRAESWQNLSAVLCAMNAACLYARSLPSEWKNVSAEGCDCVEWTYGSAVRKEFYFTNAILFALATALFLLSPPTGERTTRYAVSTLFEAGIWSLVTPYVDADFDETYGALGGLLLCGFVAERLAAKAELIS